MRTDDFRYTEWAKWDGRTQRPVWGVRAEAFPSCTRCIVTEIYLCHACSCHEISSMETAGQVLAGRELYDHRGDDGGEPAVSILESVHHID
eukprot:SAG25_NODE_21_length_22373_cov_13.904373_12_plen_91_part_00